MELDELPESWSVNRLADLCEIRLGKTPSRGNRAYWGGDKPWASIRDLNDEVLTQTKEGINETAVRECGCKIVSTGTLLFSFKLTIGKMAFAGAPIFTNEAIAALPVKPGVKLEPKFLFYALKVVPLLEGVSNAAKGKTLNKQSLAEIQIPVPPLAEQRRIVAQVEALTRHLDQARQARQATLAETKTFISAQRCKLLQTIHGAKKSRFEDLILETQLGIDRSRAQQSSEHSWAYLKMNNITARGTLDLESVTRIEATPDEVAKFTLREGDFLFNTRNSFELVGKTAVWRSSNEPVLFNNNIMRIRFRDGVDPRFVNAVFVSPLGEKQLLAFKKQTTSVCAIYWKNLKEVAVPIPSLAEQRRIVESLDKLEAKLDELQRLQREVEVELASFTPALLAKAFRGEF